MPLDFNREVPEPTLGRRPRVSAADRRLRWPRHELVAGFRSEGGYCSSMGKTAFSATQVSRHVAELKKREHTESLKRPEDVDYIEDSDAVEVTEDVDYVAFSDEEASRLLADMMNGMPEIFNRGVLPELEVRREPEMLSWSLRAHRDGFYCVRRLGEAEIYRDRVPHTRLQQIVNEMLIKVAQAHKAERKMQRWNESVGRQIVRDHESAMRETFMRF